jgi:hypothetical protein
MPESETSNRLLGFVALVAVAILLVVTNPSADRHRDALARDFAQERPLAGAVGLGAVSAQLPDYQSFVLGSYTTDDGGVTSIGALGMVWVVKGEAR